MTATPPKTTSCPGWVCDTENQYCSDGGRYCCKKCGLFDDNLMWVKTDEDNCANLSEDEYICPQQAHMTFYKCVYPDDSTTIGYGDTWAIASDASKTCTYCKNSKKGGECTVTKNHGQCGHPYCEYGTDYVHFDTVCEASVTHDDPSYGNCFWSDCYTPYGKHISAYNCWTRGGDSDGYGNPRKIPMTTPP